MCLKLCTKESGPYRTWRAREVIRCPFEDAAGLQEGTGVDFVRLPEDTKKLSWVPHGRWTRRG